MGHISFSEAKNWDFCPFYHKLMNIDKVRGFEGNAFTAFGNAIHDTCEKMMSEDGVIPTIDHLYEFLDKCVETFGEEYIKTMHHIGITELVRSEWLFKNNVNK